MSCALQPLPVLVGWTDGKPPFMEGGITLQAHCRCIFSTLAGYSLGQGVWTCEGQRDLVEQEEEEEEQAEVCKPCEAQLLSLGFLQQLRGEHDISPSQLSACTLHLLLIHTHTHRWSRSLSTRLSVDKAKLPDKPNDTEEPDGAYDIRNASIEPGYTNTAHQKRCL